MSQNYKISEEKNIFDDHLLDIIGNEFKFDHEKGISEWLKNSMDAYIRSRKPDSEQIILLKFSDSEIGRSRIECVDFVGMSADDIDKALKRWGDPSASKRGLKLKTYGGHGNGGKFYMRQMFDTSQFITYKDGYLSIFGFSENKKYGYAVGYKQTKIKPDSALKIANLSKAEIPLEYLSSILSGKCGFTVVRGVGPKGMKNKIKANAIIEALKNHPQSMRILDRIKCLVIHNDHTLYERLPLTKLTPLQGFELPRIIQLSSTFKYRKDDGTEEDIELGNEKYLAPVLTLKTSEVAMTRGSRYSNLNRIDILGEIGVIASYQLRELGLYYPQTDFIYGECVCAILEDPSDDCVTNDRARLVDNYKTKILLELITKEVENLCREISKTEEKVQTEVNKKASTLFNNFLDEWKNRFMNQVLTNMLIGTDENFGLGFSIRKNSELKGGEKNSNKKNFAQKGDSGGPGDIVAKGARFPKVLLSGQDRDPLNPEQILELHPGQGLIYQRPADVQQGLYWINTSSPLAAAISEQKGGQNSPRWRDYLFQRYVDIFVKEALLSLEKKEPERFNAATIDGEILSKLVTKIHEAAANDLASFLFDERFEVE